jgi:hypothetical protein
MLEINDEIPFLWRLSADKEEGFSLVSMVVPFNSSAGNVEHTIHTDVISFTGENEPGGDEEVLEWNEEDIALFLKLLAIRHHQDLPPEGEPGKSRTFRVDLSDPETIEIVHIVAAAGFGMALNVDDLLVTDPGDKHMDGQEPDVGSRITLHTVDGYKRGVVVGHEEDEVVCVLLDPIRPDHNHQLNDIHPHDLVIVQPHHLLPAYYSSQEPGTTDILH